MGLTGCYHNFGAEPLLYFGVCSRLAVQNWYWLPIKKVKNRVNDLQNTTFYV